MTVRLPKHGQQNKDSAPVVLSKNSWNENQRRAPLACEVPRAFAAPVFVFQTSSSSPWALIRDPNSHSSAALWLFQHLSFLCSRAFLNRQLEHEPNRRTDAIRRVSGRWGRSQREEEEGFYCHVPVVDKEERWKAKSAHALNQGYLCSPVSDHTTNNDIQYLRRSDTDVPLCESEAGSRSTTTNYHREKSQLWVKGMLLEIQTAVICDLQSITPHTFAESILWEV